MNEDQIAAVGKVSAVCSTSCAGLTRRDKAELCSRIRLRMTYKPGSETLKAEIVSDLGRVLNVCPRGDPHASQLCLI
ncbi:hypothetical protein [Actinoplanes siamensis]|uniref:Uncharacterized protein n=1 Tax=Actinoplanes siamensis TaxID=1223317 RepID=A0A919NC17_9ACTN|nr:hypothetical protein [Actinoplanes siamensis]GIF08419.1 hypothetical protein Asi03nite_59570 [Actinoplanes siamensis]